MKRISDKIQAPFTRLKGFDPHLLARKVGSGEVGIMIGWTWPDKVKKETGNAIYWNSKEDAIADLEAVIAYFKSDEDED